VITTSAGSVAGRPADEVARLNPADLSLAGYALAVMNSIAIAREAGYVERDLLARSMGRSFVTTIKAAQPYIDHLEKVRGFRPYPFAENLAAQLSGSDSMPVPSTPDLSGPSRHTLRTSSPDFDEQVGSNDGI
jgi:hypothetical protein